jgi:hypothetical protein
MRGRRAARHRAKNRRVSLAPLVGHLTRTMPWPVLLSGCVAGLGISLVAHQLAHPSENTSIVTLVVRVAFVPLVATVAFLAYDAHRTLVTALPFPKWVAPAMQLFLAIPPIALTLLGQLELAADDLKRAADNHQGSAAPGLPWQALCGEFIAWSAIVFAVASTIARSRWQDLGGSVAAPAGLAIIALLAVTPLGLLPSQLLNLTKSQRTEWMRAEWLWCAIAILACLIAWWANRDPWLRIKFPLRKRAVRIMDRRGECSDQRATV